MILHEEKLPNVRAHRSYPTSAFVSHLGRAFVSEQGLSAEMVKVAGLGSDEEDIVVIRNVDVLARW